MYEGYRSSYHLEIMGINICKQQYNKYYTKTSLERMISTTGISRRAVVSNVDKTNDKLAVNPLQMKSGSATSAAVYNNID